MSVLGSVGGFLVPKDARKLAAPLILLGILLYFYTQGPVIFGTLWTSSGFDHAILLYILLALAATAFAPILFKTPPTAPLWQQLLVYLGAAVALNVTILLSGARITFAPAAGNYVAIVALQIAVSGSEELFFRGALYRTGPLISSASFAAFHALAYGLNPVPLAFAFGAGIAFYFIYRVTKDRYGLAINTGAHFGYNLALLGVSLIPIGALFGGA